MAIASAQTADPGSFHDGEMPSAALLARYAAGRLAPAEVRDVLRRHAALSGHEALDLLWGCGGRNVGRWPRGPAAEEREAAGALLAAAFIRGLSPETFARMHEEFAPIRRAHAAGPAA